MKTIRFKRCCMGICLLFLCFLLGFSLVPHVAYAETVFSGGDGTVENPYRISTANDLTELAQKVNDGTKNSSGALYASCSYILTANIDMTDENFTPIGIGNNTYTLIFDLYNFLNEHYTYFEDNNPGGFQTDYWATAYSYFYTDAQCTVQATSTFDDTGATRYYYQYATPNAFYGTFDGNGHSIHNIKYLSSTSLYGGLFGYIRNATIKDLSVYDATITCSKEGSSVGGLVGYATGSVITGSNIDDNYTYCVSSSCVLTGTYVGGIVGQVGSRDVEAEDAKFHKYNILDCDACCTVLNQYQCPSLSLCGSKNNSITATTAAAGIVGKNSQQKISATVAYNISGDDYLSISQCYGYRQENVLSTITATDKTNGYASDILALSAGKDCQITNCLAQAPISATYTGGITGGMETGCTIYADGCFSILKSNPLFSSDSINIAQGTCFYEDFDALQGDVSALLGENCKNKTSTYNRIFGGALRSEYWTVPTHSGTTYYYPVLNGSNLSLPFTAYGLYISGTLENLFYKNATFTFSFDTLPSKTGYTAQGWQVTDDSVLYQANATKTFTMTKDFYVSTAFALEKPILNISTVSATFDGTAHTSTAGYSHTLYDLEKTEQEQVLTSSYEWKKGNETVSSVNTLSLTHVEESGEYSCTVTVEDADGKTATQSKTVQITILPVSVVIDIKNQSTFEYGFTPDQATCSPTTLTSGDTFSVYYLVSDVPCDTEPTTVQTYTVSARPDNTGKIYDSDYTVSNAIREITKKKVTIEVALTENEVTYTGTAVTTTNNFTAKVGDDDVSLHFGTSSDSLTIPSDVGEYYIHAYLLGAQKDYYELTETPAQLTITPATFTAVPTDTTYTFTYDKTEHILTLDDFTLQNVQGEQTVTLQTSGLTDATTGTEIEYTLSAPNHNDVKGSVTFVINKKAVTLIKKKDIDEENRTKEYDGSSYYSADCWIGCYDDTIFTLTDSRFKKGGVEQTYGEDLLIEGKFALIDENNYTLSGDNTLSFGSASITDMLLTVSQKKFTTAGKYNFTKIYDGKTEMSINVPSNAYSVRTSTGSLLSTIKTVSGTLLPTITGTLTYSQKDIGDCTCSLCFTVNLTDTYYKFADGKTETFTFYEYPAQITVREITLSGVTSSNRTYDGTTVITGLTGGKLNNVITSDKANLGFTLGNGTISAPNASGTAYTVTYTPVLTGTVQTNYTLTKWNEVSVLISKATPTVEVSYETSEIIYRYGQTYSEALPKLSVQEDCVDGDIDWDACTGDKFTNGTHVFSWTFTPIDTVDYTVVTGSASITVVLLSVVSLEVSDNDSAITFYVRDYFTPLKDGTEYMTITARYNDGTTKIISYPDYSCELVSGHSAFSSVDDNKVRFIYTENALGGGTTTVETVYTASVVRKQFDYPTVSSVHSYNEVLQMPTFSGFDDKEMCFTEDSQKSGTAAGNYTVFIALTDTDYAEWADGTQNTYTLPWIIMKKQLAVPTLSKSAQAYDGNVIEVTLHKDYSTSTLFFLAETSTLQATDVGTYSCYIELTDADNYKWTTTDEKTATVTWQIVAKKVTKPTFYNLSEYVYSGENVIIQTDVSTDYTVTGDLTRCNVGSYSVTATLNNAGKANLVWADGSIEPFVFRYSIVKQSIDIPVCAVRTYEYSGAYLSLKIPEGKGYTVSGDIRKINCGSYKTTLSLVDVKNCQWADETIADLEYKWSITPIVVTKPTCTQNSVYTGSEQTATILGNNEYYTLSGNKATDVGTYYAVATLKNTSAQNYVWSDYTYTPLTIRWVIQPFVADKPQQPDNLLYTGIYQTVYIETSSAYTIRGNSAKDAGTYQATVTLLDEENYAWSDGTTAPYVITWKICALVLSLGDDNTKLETTYSLGSTLATPYKSGYSFVGWYTSPEFLESSKVTELSELTENTTLYAKWQEIIDNEEEDEDEKETTLSTTAIIGISILGGTLVLSGLFLGLFFTLRVRGKRIGKKNFF